MTKTLARDEADEADEKMHWMPDDVVVACCAELSGGRCASMVWGAGRHDMKEMKEIKRKEGAGDSPVPLRRGKERPRCPSAHRAIAPAASQAAAILRSLRFDIDTTLDPLQYLSSLMHQSAFAALILVPIPDILDTVHDWAAFYWLNLPFTYLEILPHAMWWVSYPPHILVPRPHAGTCMPYPILFISRC